MLSTIHTNALLEFLSTSPSRRFQELWGEFVVSGKMNQTTLYRIIERLKKEGKIHEIDAQGNRFFCVCHMHEKCSSGIEIQVCKKCDSSYERHFPLDEDTLHAEKIAYLKHCIACK